VVTRLALRIGQAAAAQPDLPAAGSAHGDLDLDLAARGVDGDRRAERGFPGGEPQLNVEITPVEAVSRVRRDPHDEIEVAVTRPVAAATALPGQPDPLAVRYPGRHRDFQGPARAFAGQRDGPARAPVGLFDGELELGLLVGAGDRSPAPPGPAAEDAAQELLEIYVATGAETVASPEAAAAEAAAGLASAGAGSAAPPLVWVDILGNLPEVGPEGVVAAPCLRVGQGVVGLRDLLEPVLGRRVGVDVRVVGAG
jgi:hypothetical protein